MQGKTGRKSKLQITRSQRLTIKPLQRKIIGASIITMFAAGMFFLYWNFGIQKDVYGIAINYTWNGTSDSLWNNSANWTPSGIPGSADNVTIGLVATKNPYLNGNQLVNNVTMNTGGKLYLNEYLLTTSGIFTMNSGSILDIKNDSLILNGNAVINGGTIINSGSTGYVKAQGTSTTFGNSTGGPTISVDITVNSPTIYSRNTTFNGLTLLNKTGATNDASVGNNTFNGLTTVSSSSTGYFLFANATRDVFNAEVTFSSRGTGIIYPAYNGISTQFNQNITVNSTSTGGVRFGASSGSSILAASKIINVGSLGFSGGMLMLGNFTSAGTSNQNFNLTGSAILTLGPASTFTGDVTSTSGGLCLSGATFNGAALLTKNGATNDAGTGNNTFNGLTTISNSGTGYLILSNSTRDIFNTQVTFSSSGTGIIYPAYNGTGTQFNQHILVNSTSTGGVRIGANTGTSILAASKTVTSGSLGFTGGMLMLARLTSAGTTDQTINLTGTAVLTVGPNAVFNGNFSATGGGICLSGATYNGTATFIKNGTTNDAGSGNNIFNGITSITNNGTGYLLTANTTRDIYNAEVTFTSTASGIIYPAYNGTGTEFNEQVIVNSTSTGGVRIGASTGTSTLAATKTITPGSTGFTSGMLMLANLTSPGGTNHTFNLTGSSVLTLGPGTVFSGDVTAVCGGICLSGTTFNGAANLTKTGTSNDAGTGNNVFNGATSLTNSGSGYMMSANTTRDIFNTDATFTSTAAGIIYLAHNGTATQFNQNIIINSTGTGGIRIGASNGTSSLADSKSVIIGSLGFSSGMLMLANFSTTGTTPLSILSTGSSILSLGPGSTFTGDVTAVCGGICLNGGTFHGLSTFAKTGSSNDAGTGNNTFNAATTITNSGTGYFLLANSTRDIFNGDVTFTTTTSGLIYPAYNGINTQFNQNIVVNSNGTGGIRFGASNGTSSLADGKTISIGSTGYGSGELNLRKFTQTGNTTQTLNISTGTASLYLSTGTTFNGDVNFAFPQVYLNGATYNQVVLIDKKGATNNTSTGANIFNGETTIKNSGTGIMYLANTTGDDFNSKVTFIQNGTGVLYPSYNTNSTFGGDISTLGTATAITFGYAAGGIITMDGNVPQNFYGSSTLPPVVKRLTVNNANNGVTFNVPVTVSTNLTLTSGNLNTSTGTMMIIGSGVTAVSGGNDQSYIAGPVRKIGNTAFTFPTGKNGKLRPISISAPSLVTDHFTAEYFAQDPDSLYPVASKDASLNRITRCEYWALNRTNGSAAVNVSLSWDSTDCSFANPSDMRVANWEPALLKWRDLGNGGTTGNALSGSLSSSTTTTIFGGFTLGAATSAALPIELISFTVTKDGNAAQLKWQTATEINNDYFTIDRSLDGKNYENIGTVAGSGNSTHAVSYDLRDENPLAGTSYYRLKQTDYNGKYEFFKPIMLKWDEENAGFEITGVGPNPFENVLHLQLNNASPGDATLVLINVAGNMAYSETLMLSEGRQTIDVNLTKELKAGIYFLKLIKENEQSEPIKLIRK